MYKNSFVLIAVLLISFTTFAQDKKMPLASAKSEWGVILLPISIQFISLRNEDQNQALQTMPMFTLGVKYKNFDILLERGSFKISDGNDSLAIEQEVEMYSLMVRYSFINWSLFALYAGVGFGTHNEKVSTRVMSFKTTDTSKSEMFTHLSAGVKFNYKILLAEAEVRTTQAKYLDPTFTYGVITRLGLLFRF